MAAEDAIHAKISSPLLLVIVDKDKVWGEGLKQGVKATALRRVNFFCIIICS